MENLAVYFIKSAVLLAAFVLGYYLLLRKETFFTSNRWYFLVGLVTSVLLPLVTFKKVILVEPKPLPLAAAEPLPALDWTAIPPIMPEPEPFQMDWYLVAAIVYGLGVLFFLIKFALDFYALHKILKGKTIRQQADYKLVDIAENVSPFSYFNYIVYNSSLYSAEELENILEHEKAHSSQNHTVDVLVARIFCIAFWWNPFVWFYKKAMLQNLEFIADSEAAKRITDKKAYQFTLLKITTHDCCVAITNHFYQSLIKKRIVMLNKNQSTKWNSWKYVVIVPVLVAFMVYFQVRVIAQEKQIVLKDGSTVSLTTGREVTDMTWTKNTTDAEFKEDAKAMKSSGITFKFSDIKRNANGEITGIKLSYKDKLGNKETKVISGTEPIKPIRFLRDIDMNGKGQIGLYLNENEPRTTYAYSYSYSNSDDDDDDIDVDVDMDLDTIAVGTANVMGNFITTSENGDDVVVIRNGNGNGNGVKFPGQAMINLNGDTKPVVIVNGKRIADADAYFSKINGDAIATVNIMGGDDASTKLYGTDAKNGVIVVHTKEINREALKRAKEEMKKARIEMDRARPEMDRAKAEMRAARREQELSKPELEQAKKEIEQAREEIKQAKIEIEKARAEMEAAKKQKK